MVERADGEVPPVADDVVVVVVDKNPFINRRSFCRFFFPPGPAGPVALCVFIPEALIISISSNLKAEISFLISLTSSSVTPSFSAFRCS